VLQNAAVAQILEFLERIDAADQRDALQFAVRPDDLGDQPLPRLELALQATDGDLLAAFEADRLPRRAFLEYQRNDAHAHQIGAVDALEGLRDHGADAEQRRALGRPVARRAG